MAPNEHGVCTVCVTLDWECICINWAGLSRFTLSEVTKSEETKNERDIKQDSEEIKIERGIQQESGMMFKIERDIKQQSEKIKIEPSVDSQSDLDFEDVVSEAQTLDRLYGVSWKYFENKEVGNALANASEIALDLDVDKYYIGIAKTPAFRFYEKPEPHCMKYQVMYVLLVGIKMGTIEKQFIKECKRIRPSAIENKSNGGEGIHPKSIRFLYICVRKRGH